MSEDKRPYKEFGVAIKAFRVAANESESDVADALEVTEHKIHRIENGIEQPSADLLEIFINHFNLREKEADRLWDLAKIDKNNLQIDLGELKLPTITGEDNKSVMYTDMVHIVSNKFGVVINFVQSSNNTKEPIVISRVGMSKEHAKYIADALMRAVESLEAAEDKDLENFLDQ